MSKSCAKCGSELSEAAISCPECGTQVDTAPAPSAAPDPTPFHLAWQTQIPLKNPTPKQEFTINDAILTYSEDGEEHAAASLNSIRRVTLSSKASIIAWVCICVWYLGLGPMPIVLMLDPDPDMALLPIFLIIDVILVLIGVFLRYYLYHYCLEIEVQLEEGPAAFCMVATKRQIFDQIVQALTQRVALPPVQKRSALMKVIVIVAIWVIFFVYVYIDSYVFDGAGLAELACLMR